MRLSGTKRAGARSQKSSLHILPAAAVRQQEAPRIFDTTEEDEYDTGEQHQSEPTSGCFPMGWLKTRTDFLAEEKDFTRVRDDLSRRRRELPWERVEKN